MKRKHAYLLLFTLVLTLGAGVAVWRVYHHPAVKLIQTTRLIEHKLPDVGAFYTPRFIDELRLAMHAAVNQSQPADTALQAAINVANANRIFIAGLAHIVQNKAGWPAVKDEGPGTIQVVFTIQAPRNLKLTMHCLMQKEHLVFDSAEGLANILAVDRQNWAHILANPGAVSQ